MQYYYTPGRSMCGRHRPRRRRGHPRNIRRHRRSSRRPQVYGNVWQKTRSNWRLLADRHASEFDFVIYGGDDYLVLVENLRAYLSSEEVRMGMCMPPDTWGG